MAKAECTSARAWVLGLRTAWNSNNTSTDRASICDEFINPLYASVEGCTVQPRGVGSGWRSAFDGAMGILGDVAVGLHVNDWLRVEAELATQRTNFNQTHNIGFGTGATGDKLRREIYLAQERLGSFASNGIFANGYFDYGWDWREFSFYGGAGVGLAFTSTGYSSLWARNKDVENISTGSDQPNADEIRANLAGTVSHGHAKLSESLFAWQVMLGIDQNVSENVSIGLKARWVHFANLESTDLEWNPLRSHAPNIRLNGSEPVHAIIRTDDLGSLSLGLVVKRRF